MRRAALVLVGTALLCTTTPAAAQPVPPPYRPPVDAPVVDPFRPPSTPFGPGNRGLEYGTAAGSPALAAADGRVVFAGSVAGTLHVTVRHDDGVRTTYSFLQRIDVVTGELVRQGAQVGLTRGHLHFGARRGDSYFDPASLFTDGMPSVHLVPFDEPPGEGEQGERSAIGQLIDGAGRLLGGVAATPGAVGDWLRTGGPQLLRTIDHYASRFTYPSGFVDAGLTILQSWQQARSASERPCTASSAPTPTPSGRRLAVLVAGLGSNSGSSTVDQVHTGELGYAAADVLRFSYAGGRVPDATDGLQTIEATDYDAPETQTDLRATGLRLADLVEQVAAASPGVPIDLIAHSQGGVVARLALIELERRHGEAWLERVGLLATLGSPHGGADIATAVHAWSSTSTGGDVLDVFATATDQELDDDATSIGQLAETSDLVAELGRSPVPDTVDAVSIAARGDLVVPVPRSQAPGMDEVVVPLMGTSAHSDLPGSAQATRELALARAGLPPGCQSFREALLDQGMGQGVSLAEDLGGSGRVRARRPSGRARRGTRPIASPTGLATAWPHHTKHPGHPAVASSGAPGPAPALLAQRTTGREPIVAVVTMKQLLEAGVHFGHQTRRWNPKMKRFIFGERGGIYIIDPAADADPDRGCLHVRARPGRRRRHHPLHRHEEAGAGPHPELCREGRDAVHQPALAGRHAHELRDHRKARRQDAGVPPHASLRRVRRHAQEGSPPPQPRAREARAEPGRHRPDGAPSRRRVHPRHQEGAHRCHRGEQARHPDHRRRRHQLRPPTSSSTSSRATTTPSAPATSCAA